MASAKALNDFPEVNSSIIGEEIITYKQVNIGIAVQTNQGLLVPVLKNANKMRLNQIAEESSRLINSAREGRINPDELKGGTFTISNLGMFDVDYFTAIINPPESAILAVASIKDRAVVNDKGIVAKPIMKSVLSVDHRLIDGVLAVKFLNRIKLYLENPELLCL